MATELIKAHFQIKGISVPDEWIEQCSQFLQQEFGNQLKNQSILKDKAYEQWLLTDLNDLGSSSLPQNLANVKCTHIKGKFILQINKIQDVGMSSYKQHLKLNKEENENVDVSAAKTEKPWHPKPTRMLMLELTDGTSVVSGMEYRSIPALNLSIAPGSKIFLEGEIEVRRGILMLTANHVKKVEGSVESFSVSQSQDNVLRRALGLEETENPVTFEEASRRQYIIEDTSGLPPGWRKGTQPSQSDVKDDLSALPPGWRKGTLPSQPVRNKDTPGLHPKWKTRPKHSQPDVKDNTSELPSGWQRRPKPSQHIKIEKNNSSSIKSKFTKNKQPPPPLVDDFDDFLDADVEMALMEADAYHLSAKRMNVPIASSSCGKISHKPILEKVSSKSKPNLGKLFSKTKPQNALPIAKTSTSQLSKSKPSNNKFDILPVTHIKSERRNPSDSVAYNKYNTSNAVKMEAIHIDDSDEEALAMFLAAGEFEDENIARNVPAKCFATTSHISQSKFIKLGDQTSTTRMPTAPTPNPIRTEMPQPFQYLIAMPHTVIKKVHYTIKAFVMTLTSKLGQENGIHILTVLLNDGTGYCEANIHNDVIKGMIGINADDLCKRIKESRTNSSLRTAIVAKMNTFQKSLISMSCLFKLELSPAVERPTVVEILPIQASHLYQLKGRLHRK